MIYAFFSRIALSWILSLTLAMFQDSDNNSEEKSNQVDQKLSISRTV